MSADAQEGAVADPELQAAYAHCLAQVRAHYENFPVASWLLPARLRGPVAAIYAFARRADDHADEGQLDAAERLQRLALEGMALDAYASGSVPADPVHRALADAVARHQLPVGLLHDLLTAFRMDVTRHRYADFAELLDYCRHSANPVGRLLLHLFDQATRQNLQEADAICSGLQLVNLWQDLAQDVGERDRLYLPRDTLRRFGVAEADVLARRDSPALARALHYELDRTEALLRSGMPLGGRLPGRLGLEIRLTVEGGLAILRALRARESSFARPRLPRTAWPALLLRALWPGRR
ncbi:MAG TPA: squalene synthase HpnC, partial [Gammaproteobacteria bacterium]